MSVLKTTSALLLTGLVACSSLAADAPAEPREIARSAGAPAKPKTLKLYWFVPDGLRADPATFKVFEWARQGLLPNIKWLMDHGTYGYSIPVFPSHTPANYAALMTGSWPRTNGISDGAMRLEGFPLRTPVKGGFSSSAKKVPPIWYTLEQEGFSSALLSLPGSTPPELKDGITLRGRWGGWGADFPAAIFQTADDADLRERATPDMRALFGVGPELTQLSSAAAPSGWEMTLPRSFSPPREIFLSNWGLTVHAYLYDSIDDGKENYDRVLFSRDKKTLLADLGEGQWSDWLSGDLKWPAAGEAIPSSFRIRVIKLGTRGYFRIRFLYDNLNPTLIEPSILYDKYHRALGPMVDFVDNFPPQLIYLPEDKAVFLEESAMSFDWHSREIPFVLESLHPDAVIQSVYSPNQMLTSRWWLGSLDPQSKRYGAVSEPERARLWDEVLSMYKRVDGMIGEIIRGAGPDTCIVLSSDHGAIPLEKEVLINNLLAEDGLLSVRPDPKTGEPQIDWERSQAVFLQINSVYLNPRGLGGDYHRASGAEYDRLRHRVAELLKKLSDEDGGTPVAGAVNWEDAKTLGLPDDRIGDLTLAYNPGYSGVEGFTPDRKPFRSSLKGGYKQSVFPETTPGLWTPFVIVAPGIKKNFALPRPIRHIDQYPTIMRALKVRIPSFVDGKPLEEAFEPAR